MVHLFIPSFDPPVLAKVEQELQGIISPVKYSAAPIVPVIKQGKQSVRICSDYKLTASHVEHYLLPNVDGLLQR